MKSFYITHIARLYIRIKYKKEHKKERRLLPDNYKLILQEFAEKSPANGARILYLWFWDYGGKYPNAAATIPGLIVINCAWALLLIDKCNDETTTDAFNMTVGHERTHQEKDYPYIRPFTKNQKFVNWINEIHADYGGIMKAFEGDVNRGINALEFKKNCKGDKDKDHRSHPSWKSRIDYMDHIKKNGFNANLIKQVAKDTGCKDQKLINKVCEHYGIEVK